MTIFLSLVLKGAAVLLVAALAVRLLRHAPASLRHGIWAAAFGALLLLPVLEAAGPRWAVGLLPASSTVSSSRAIPAPPPPPPAPPAPPAPPPPPAVLSSSPVAPGFETRMEQFEDEMESFDEEMARFEDEMEALASESAATSMTSVSVRSLSPRAPATTRIAGWLLALWAVGIGAVGVWWAGAGVAASRLIARAYPETDEEWSVLADRARRLSGLTEPVRLLRSPDLDVPIAWGYGSPAVVLPESADEWGEDRREAVLLHEMAHLRRRDAWTQIVAQAAVAVHWFNPLAWWAYHQHLDAREQACDDAVIQSGARPSAYAAHLIGVARAIKREPAALAAVAPMARTAPLETRITSILDADRRRGQLGRLSRLGTIALTLGILIPIAAFRPVEAEAEPIALEVVAPAIETGTETPAPPEAPETAASTSEGADKADPPSRTVAQAQPDTLEVVRDQIRDAQREVRRALADARGVDAEVARAQLYALRAADRALEGVDLDEIRRDAIEAEREIREARLEALEDEREARLEDEEDRREAEEDAREDALEALEDAREALGAVGLARVWSEAKRGLETGWPAVQRVSPAAPARPTPPVPPATPSVDWDSVDRARTNAVRQAGSETY